MKINENQINQVMNISITRKYLHKMLCVSVHRSSTNQWKSMKINENHKLLYKVTNISIGCLVCPLVSSKLGKITKTMKINENQHNQVVNISIKSQTSLWKVMSIGMSVCLYTIDQNQWKSKQSSHESTSLA